jgi:aminopeptidase C
VPEQVDLPALIYPDELEKLRAAAARRGMTPEQLLGQYVERDLNEAISKITRPAAKRGTVRPFRRKPD